MDRGWFTSLTNRLISFHVSYHLVNKLKDIEPAEEIMDRVMRLYSRRPRGWHVLHTPVGDMLIIGPDSAFQLRMMPLSPRESIGVGVELPNVPERLSNINSAPDFGIRGLTDEDLEVMLGALQGDAHAMDKVDAILKRDPLPPSAIETEKIDHIISGPIFSRPSLASIDPSLGDITEYLDASVRDLFRERYPLRSGMYF